MSEDELEKIADRLAEKLQDAVITNVYRDAGKSLLGMFKNVMWAAVIAIAAWGSARYGGNG